MREKSDIGIHDVLKPCGSARRRSMYLKEKVNISHIDVMDGEFVPNFGLGVDYIRGLRELTIFRSIFI